MFKDALRNVEGLEIYPTISFVIFFLFFFGLMFYVYGLTKNHTANMSNMPLDENNNTIKTTKTDSNE
ncbi:MAG: CcoQ/FixQ family Cbb3-type cytochrome c oxidase assembly chaperone [Polaribacter sp.]